MKDYYKYTRNVLDKYNNVQDKIRNNDDVTTELEDEFLQNFYLHLAHALVKDTGYGQASRDELEKVADIINIAVR